MTLARTAIAVLSLCFAVTASAQSRSGLATLSHELLFSFQRVGAPVPSPDGRWVVFAVAEPSYDPQKDVSDLWIVPADGSSPPRRLTSNRGSESGPAWSPDSTRIAFAARRDDDEVNQIYVMDVVRGGEAQRVTAAPTAASSPRWSPDGKTILFQAAMWPGATDEDSNRKVVQERKNVKSKVRVYETFPIRNFDRWIEESKTHLWVVAVEGDRRARSLFGASPIVARAGFGADSLTAAWTPDGQAVVFAANEDDTVAARATVVSHLWHVSASGGDPKRLTPDGWDYGAPAFRSDGKMLCFTAADARPAIYQLNRLACTSWPAASLPLTSSAISIVTKSFDRAVASWTFSTDGQSLMFSAEDAGHERVYSVPVTGGTAKVVVDAPQGVYTNVQAPSRSSAAVAFANWESAIRPAEIVRLDPATGARTFLTSFTTKTAESIDWQPLREFWFNGRDGRRIHSFLALPPGFDESKKYPLFVLIHGGHASMWRDSITYRWNYHLLSQPGFVVLLTDYRGSTGYGEKFTLDIKGDPLAGPADDINDAADEAIKRFAFIDGSRQAAGGASYGGHLTNWLAGTTTRYRCLVSHAGLATLEMQWGISDSIYHRELMMGGPYWENTAKWIEQSPLAKAGNFKTPMLLSVGLNDFRVPEGNTLTMYAALQRMKVPSRLLIWPDENHWILKGENSRIFYREVRAWLEKYLLPTSPPTAAAVR